MNTLRKTNNNIFLVVLCLSFLLGMAVALGVYIAWRVNMGGLHSSGLLTAIALFICPPYVLPMAIGPIPDSDLALVLTVGTMVFGNAFLYSGMAAGGYFIVTLMAKKARR